MSFGIKGTEEVKPSSTSQCFFMLPLVPSGTPSYSHWCSSCRCCGQQDSLTAHHGLNGTYMQKDQDRSADRKPTVSRENLSLYMSLQRVSEYKSTFNPRSRLSRLLGGEVVLVSPSSVGR